MQWDCTDSLGICNPIASVFVSEYKNRCNGIAQIIWGSAIPLHLFLFENKHRCNGIAQIIWGSAIRLHRKVYSNTKTDAMGLQIPK
jgi:hypothetical protein